MQAQAPVFTLIAVTSRDGRITGPLGEPPMAWASAAEQQVFHAAVDALDWSFIGRRTHLLAWRPERYRVVFSHSCKKPLWRHPRRLWVDPERTTLDAMLELLRLVRKTEHCGILGGVGVHDWFAAAGRIDRASITIEPLTFDAGLPLFSAAPGEDPRATLPRLGLRQTDERALNPEGTLLCQFSRCASRPPPSRAEFNPELNSLHRSGWPCR